MKLSYVWDYDIDEAQFCLLLDGKQQIGRLDRDWAAIRLLEYARIQKSFVCSVSGGWWRAGPGGVSIFIHKTGGAASIS